MSLASTRAERPFDSLPRGVGGASGAGSSTVSTSSYCVRAITNACRWSRVSCNAAVSTASTDRGAAALLCLVEVGLGWRSVTSCPAEGNARDTTKTFHCGHSPSVPVYLIKIKLLACKLCKAVIQAIVRLEQ